MSATAPPRVGCAGFAVPPGPYARQLDCVEIGASFRRPLPDAVCDRLRAAVPDSFAFAVTAWMPVTHPASFPGYTKSGLPSPLPEPESYGLFQTTETVLGAWERTRAMADRLRAEWIVLRCPKDFTPTLENYAALRTFLETVDRGAGRIAWSPAIAWPGDMLASLYENLGLVPVADPLAGRPPNRDMAYFRLPGRGWPLRSGEPTHDQVLLRLRKACEGNREPWLFLATPGRFEDAVRLKDLTPIGRRTPRASARG